MIPMVSGGIQTALPSKTGVCLSCGQPAIFAFGENCYFAEDARQCSAGICINADDFCGMANAIKKFANVRNGEKRYELFMRYFRKKKNVVEYVKEITN